MSTEQIPLNWSLVNNQLYICIKLNSFENCMDFMQKVAFHISKLDHHPTWTNTYNTLEIWLSTHSAGNVVTSKDIQLATIINNLLVETQY